MIIAEAIFCKPGSNKIKGSVTFSQYNDMFVRVDIDLKNVPSGTHGIHVHEKPINFRRKDDFCAQAKAHFNGSQSRWSPKVPGGTPHGSFELNTDRHVGDLCNNITSIHGIVKMTYIDYLINLIPGHPHCIVGKSIIIHDDEDDQGLYVCKNIGSKEKSKLIKSKITGNAGKRIACANINYILNLV